MTLAQLQDYTFNTKYARYSAALGRRETFAEAADRVFSMHERKYAGCGVEAELEYAKQAVKDRLVLGSQRALQFGGKPVEDKNARLYNCTVSYCDRPRFFQEALWLLLCGCGVGFSVQRHHVAKLPTVARPAADKAIFQVPDSIEGWADALGALLSSYLTAEQPFPEYHGRTVEFDFSLVRPAGSPLSSGIGKAPGPQPLKRSLEKIRQVIEERLVTAGSGCGLRPIDAYDIVMHASDAVLAGGVRRSATICIFSVDDTEMITAKTGDWFIKHPQRGRSNNSALLLREATTFEQFNNLMQSVREFGEPGFVWADSTEIMYNPCVEIGMYPVDIDTGATGWHFCNLCELNLKACTDAATFERACRAAAILGTVQAGYDRFDYLGATTERIVQREALLGCSMTGMMDNPKIAFDPVLQRKMARLILEVNEQMAAKLGINPCARATCVKPAGTTSCILGTASGIHAHHAKRYFRRVQANVNEAPLQYFQLHNPRAVEKSVWNPNGTDEVITFCIQVPEEARTKNEVSAIDLLRHVELTQENWVMAGRRPERCTAPWLRHNVSNTITVRETEWGDVARYIFDHRNAFAGVSLLPEGGDLDYPQAPFCAVLTYDEIVAEYGVGALFASGLIVDGLHAFDNDLWAACDCALGRGKKLELPELKLSDDMRPADAKRIEEQYREAVHKTLVQKDWVRRAHKFAKNYLSGDVRRMTYLLKRVNNCKLWEDLKREYIPVDYTLMHEDSDNTKLIDAQACAGGKCDV
jgi:ribonucleoside-diphosphate reductase alpha chain